MPNDNDWQVTLDDVASDRKGFSEAKAQLKKRVPLHWLIFGGSFSSVFSLAVWFLRPNAPLATYIILIVVSFVVSGFMVFMEMRNWDKWYATKAAELDSVENRVRSGERVPRPNPPLQPTAKKRGG